MKQHRPFSSSWVQTRSLRDARLHPNTLTGRAHEHEGPLVHHRSVEHKAPPPESIEESRAGSKATSMAHVNALRRFGAHILIDPLRLPARSTGTGYVRRKECDILGRGHRFSP